MSSSCVNPFLYAWFNDNFRSAFKDVVAFDRFWKNKNRAEGRRAVESHLVVEDGETEMTTKTKTMLVKMEKPA